jgi:hypothetical protein
VQLIIDEVVGKPHAIALHPSLACSCGAPTSSLHVAVVHYGRTSLGEREDLQMLVGGGSRGFLLHESSKHLLVIWLHGLAKSPNTFTCKMAASWTWNYRWTPKDGEMGNAGMSGRVDMTIWPFFQCGYGGERGCLDLVVERTRTRCAWKIAKWGNFFALTLRHSKPSLFQLHPAPPLAPHPPLRDWGVAWGAPNEKMGCAWWNW